PFTVVPVPTAGQVGWPVCPQASLRTAQLKPALQSASVLQSWLVQYAFASPIPAPMQLSNWHSASEHLFFGSPAVHALPSGHALEPLHSSPLGQGAARFGDFVVSTQMLIAMPASFCAGVHCWGCMPGISISGQSSWVAQVSVHRFFTQSFPGMHFVASHFAS